MSRGVYLLSQPQFIQNTDVSLITKKKKKRMKGCDFPLINNGRASSFVLFRSAILNLGHCEEMTPLRL